MRALVHRVKEASVRVDGELVGQIERGLLVYLGVAPEDSETDVSYLAEKIRNLRIFADQEGKMNLDVSQAGGGVLLVSSFSLLADVRKGRRPAFDGAALPELANRLYEQVAARLAESLPVATGRFAAMMDVASVNDGPINILLDSKKLF